MGEPGVSQVFWNKAGSGERGFRSQPCSLWSSSTSHFVVLGTKEILTTRDSTI